MLCRFVRVADDEAALDTLLRLWLTMVTDGGARHSHVFYEPSRLALVPFSVVFLGSDALKLLVTHWVRSPPDDGGARIDRGSGVAARRGGVDLATVEALVRECVGRDASRDLLPRFREQVGAMASLVTQPAPSAGALAVSSVRIGTRLGQGASHAQPHSSHPAPSSTGPPRRRRALSHFLRLHPRLQALRRRLDARGGPRGLSNRDATPTHSPPTSPTSLIPRLPLQVGHEGAVVKLEKMSVLRQQLHRQLAQLKRTYMPQETAPNQGVVRPRRAHLHRAAARRPLARRRRHAGTARAPRAVRHVTRTDGAAPSALSRLSPPSAPPSTGTAFRSSWRRRWPSCTR